VKKTNAVRLLEAAGVPYELRAYRLAMEAFTAAAVAAEIGLPARSVFKTLIVVVEPHRHCFAVVPGDAALDLKALARAVGGRKAHLAPLSDVRRLTGYPRGAVTVLGARHDFPVIGDPSLDTRDTVAVSAGALGLQVLLAGTDFLHVTNAATAAIAR
jgi:Cys-tRNA(Pro)/Cys-tRNA(Cys) deacylase